MKHRCRTADQQIHDGHAEDTRTLRFQRGQRRLHQWSSAVTLRLDGFDVASAGGSSMPRNEPRMAPETAFLRISCVQ